MTIINPNNMPYTPADRPTVSTVSKTTTSITYSITNTNSIEAKIFYEIGDDTPDANNITLAGGASQNVIISGLTASTSYILYTQAFTATGYSLVGNYSETTESAALYAFSSHTFTAAGITGRTGPTLAQCRAAYTSASWTQNNSFFNMTTQGIQLWTVPANGTYRIEAWGAGSNFFSNQKGARMRGDFELNEGEIINILVGQTGDPARTEAGSGGTFVVRSPYNTLLSCILAAGGAGGYWSLDNVGMQGTINSSGQNSVNSTGGSNGNGGGNEGVGGSTNGGGGGGFLTDGAGSAGSQSGFAFVNNGLASTSGGFGGGGGTGSNRVGGGGGYSGGAGGGSGSYSGGGGSINRGINQDNSSGVRSGSGLVTITKL
jgi:hypothetical protein